MQYEKELEQLNEYQKAAVLNEDKVCLVNANVGSGKTTVLIAKILYLHFVKKVSYEEMIVLTFTNKAANEIKERLILKEDSMTAEELLHVGTFHSVALHLLREKLPVETLGYTKNFLVIEPEEELDLAMQVIQEANLKIKYKNRLKKRLEQAMTDQKNPNGPSYQDDFSQLVQLLKEKKVKQDKMTFSDLIKNTNLHLSEWEEKPKWIIIDEVQDSDVLQLDFIDGLKGSDTRIFAVGDPNQVIYSWRGSTFNVFEVLKRRYEAKELSLPINYRSSSSILAAARYFLLDGSNLTGIREPGNKISVKAHYNAFQEASYLEGKIREIHAQGVPYREIAIFYRLQDQSKVFADVFARNEIPYEVSLKKTIRDIPVLNWIIKVLRFSVNPKDTTSAVAALSNKEYGERMTEKAARQLVIEKLQQESWQLEGANGLAESKTDEKLELPRLFRKMQEFVCTSSILIHNADEFYEYFELDEQIRKTSATYQQEKESLLALFDIILQYGSEKQLDFLQGVTEFISSSALYGVNILQKDMNNEEDSVKLMTLHASKGLEFSYVFITGVNYGLIPIKTRSMEEEEEERRLFFVGITRAKDHLELSYYNNPDYYRAMPGESRYLNMIPPRLLDRGSDQKENPAVTLQELKRQVQAAREESNSYSKEEKDHRSSQLSSTSLDNIANPAASTSLNTAANADAATGSKSAANAGMTLNTGEKKESLRIVHHKKYGTGKVLKEDELMTEVEFEDYGVKEFMKAFSELE